MFREMRRIKQLLSMEDTNAVMDRGTCGVMACLGDDDYPYAVPVNMFITTIKFIFTLQRTGIK